jgi:integrase
MAPKNTLPATQIVTGKNSGELVSVPIDLSDSCRWRVEQYFAFKVATLESSQVKQRRELGIFLSFMELGAGADSRRSWPSQLSGAFVNALQKEVNEENGRSPALFLAAGTIGKESGRLTARMINHKWDDMAEFAGVAGGTLHSARHAMERHVIEKTGNIAPAQGHLGHRSAAYSMRYSPITDELNVVLNEP